MNQDTIWSLIGYLLFMLAMMFSYRANWKRENWFAILSFTALIGFRSNGLDYIIYNDAFHMLVNNHHPLFSQSYLNTLEDNYSMVHFEFAHLAYIKFVQLFSTNSIWFFSAMAFSQIYCFDYFIRRYDDKRLKMWCVYFFFTCLIFVEVFNGMRQFTAYLMFICVVRYIEERDWKRYFLACILIATVHKSILILAPLYFFIHHDWLKNKKIQIAVYFTTIIAANVFINYLETILNIVFFSLDDEYYANYIHNVDSFSQEVNRSLLVYIFRLSTFFYMLINYDQFVERYGKKGVIFYNLTFVGLLLEELSFNMGIHRLNYYFFYNSFIILPLMVYDNFVRSPQKTKNMFAYFIVVLYLSWFCNSVLKEAVECAPYELSKELVLS